MGLQEKFQAVFAGFRRLLAHLAFADGILLIPLAALIAASPRVMRGISCGHDFEFHLISWFEVQRSWKEGIFYPHWAQSPNWGAGEARFVFYPPVSWMLGALAGYLFDWYWVPSALIFLFLAASGLATRAFARQFLPASQATLAGVIATSTPYALFVAYERSAFSELAATIGIPLLLLLAWRQSKRSAISPGLFANAFDGSTAPLALVLALIWLTNAPAGVIASYLLAFAALAVAVLHRSWWPVLRASVATVLGLGLAAFYLIPAEWEQRWIAIQQAVDVGMRVSDSWLFARHSSPDLELHDQVLRTASAIFVFTTLLALAGLIYCLIRGKLPRNTSYFWLPLALLIPIILILQFPVAAPIWDLLPKLQFLQFPWRWLMVLGTPYAIFLAAATPLRSRRSRVWSALIWTSVLCVFASVASLAFIQYCDDEDDVSNQVSVFHQDAGVEGTDEYAALGSDNSLVPSGLPDGCLVSDPTLDLGESDSGSEPVWFPEQGSCDEIYTARLWQNEHKILQFDSDHEGFVVLRLRRYPAWEVTVNNKAVTPSANREDGLIVVPVSARPSTIEVRWATTPDFIWGRWISLSALLLLLALWIIELRMRARRL